MSHEKDERAETMEGFEETRCQLISELYQLESSDVLKIGKEVLAPDLVTEEHSKYQVLRSLRDHLEMFKADDWAALQEVQAKIQGIKQAASLSQSGDGVLVAQELEKLREKHEMQLQQLELAFQEKMEAIQSQLHKTEEKQNNTITTPPITLPQIKELRISGQIGEAHQRDKLSFSSLIHQIDAAVERGYKDREIIEAVLKAINPSLKLRSYLENHPGLTLPILRTVLKAHFQERDATDLYQELSTISQTKSENASAFVLRALDLRQRVLLRKELA